MSNQDKNLYIDVEQDFNDSIFIPSGDTLRGRKGMLSTNSSITSALHYREPDYETYIFKNTKHLVYSRVFGIIKPVRFNRILNNKLEKTITKGLKGVYVIKYFNHHNTTDLKNIVKYYLSNVSDIADNVIQTLELELSRYIKSGSTRPLKFRITKFIKESDLLECGVYSDNLFNGDLIIGNPNRLSEFTHRNTTTSIEIAISDNTQDIYHLVLGDNIYNIYTGTSNTGNVTGNLKIVNDGIEIYSKELSSDDFAKNGLHRNKDAALEVVDIDKRMELIKLRFEKDKIDNELSMMRLKKDMQLDGYAFDMYKRSIDLELTNSKLNYEKVKLYSSSTSSYLKMGSEFGVKILTMFIPVLKIGAK